MPSFVGKDYVLVTSEEMIGLVAPVKPGTGTGSRGKNIAGRLPEVQVGYDVPLALMIFFIWAHPSPVVRCDGHSHAQACEARCQPGL